MAKNRFDGDEIFWKSIGATWFISYFYSKKIDPAHTNWKDVSTCAVRVRAFHGSTKYHEDWLNQVINMNDKKLNTNSIGLNAGQIKQMAKELLLRCKKQ